MPKRHIHTKKPIKTYDPSAPWVAIGERALEMLRKKSKKKKTSKKTVMKTKRK